MKRYLILLFSLILTLLFVFPASAVAQNGSIEEKYASLKAFSNELVKEEKIGSTEFRDLSSASAEYLQQFDINTDSVGEIYYEIDPDGVLVLKALTLLEDDSVRISTLTNYGKDNEGNYKRFNHTDLIDQIKSLSWQYHDYYDKENYNSYITFLLDLYTFRATESYSGNNHTCIRPYQSSLAYIYRTSYHPSVTNYNGSTKATGTLRYTDWTFITSNFTWSTAYNLSAPVDNTAYNRYNNLAADEMIDLYGYYFTLKHDCTFYLDGAYNNATFYF